MIPMKLNWDGSGFTLKPIVEAPKMLLEDKMAILDRALEKETPESLAIKLGIENKPDICYEPLIWIDPQATAQRTIVSAANRYKLNDGQVIVIPCVRHYSKEHHHIVDRFIETGLLGQFAMAVGDDQGFVDQYSNYWTRKEAFIIAYHADQIQIKHGPDDTLFSEDLY